MNNKCGINKRFNLGEFTLGGIIDITIFNNHIDIKAVNNITRNVIRTYVVTIYQENSYNTILKYLLQITSMFYANIIVDYIEQKTKLLK